MMGLWILVWILGCHLTFALQGPCLDGGEYYEKQNKCYYMGGTRLDPDKWIGLKEHAETWIQAERRGFFKSLFLTSKCSNSLEHTRQKHQSFASALQIRDKVNVKNSMAT